jgi:hypothetical protein
MERSGKGREGKVWKVMEQLDAGKEYVNTKKGALYY